MTIKTSVWVLRTGRNIQQLTLQIEDTEKVFHNFRHFLASEFTLLSKSPFCELHIFNLKI